MAGGTVSTAKRNRIIAVVAGAITVVAIVLAFASGYLGQQWQWLRPAGELLLLAELVGLIVLERHQLFEPVHNGVSEVKARVKDMEAGLSLVLDRLGTSGRITICANTPETTRAAARVFRAALARDYETPQILRISGLSGQLIGGDTRESTDALSDLASFANFLIRPDTAPDSRARRWSVRMLFGVASKETFQVVLELFAPVFDRALNLEVKFFPCPKIEAILSPGTVTDREAILVYADQSAALRWGIVLEDQYSAALLARWFDDRWAAIPESHVIYSRNGLNQKAVERISRELQSVDKDGERKTA
jgi:hypothetical protein